MKFASFLSVVFLTFCLGIDSISALLTPGIYQFVSVVTDPQGNALAMTDQGLNNPIIVTPLSDGQPQQLWNVTSVTGSSDAYIIYAPSSNFSANLLNQVGFLGNLPGPLSTVRLGGGNIAWMFVDGPDGITFFDTNRKGTIWQIPNAINGAGVLSARIPSDRPLLAFVAVRVA